MLLVGLRGAPQVQLWVKSAETVPLLALLLHLHPFTLRVVAPTRSSVLMMMMMTTFMFIESRRQLPVMQLACLLDFSVSD